MPVPSGPTFPFRPLSGHAVLFIDDPFEGYDTANIAGLVWNDPSVNVNLGRKLGVPLNEAVFAGYDDILTFEGGDFQVIRSSTRMRGRL